MKNPFLKRVGNKFTLMGRPATFNTGTQMQPNMEIQRYEVRGVGRIRRVWENDTTTTAVRGPKDGKAGDVS